MGYPVVAIRTRLNSSIIGDGWFDAVYRMGFSDIVDLGVITGNTDNGFSICAVFFERQYIRGLGFAISEMDMIILLY